MERFIIRGGRGLHGRAKPLGNKNAVLPMLAACVLTDEPVVLRNVPDIVDVQVMLELLAGLGVAVRRRGHTVEVCAAGLKATRLDGGLCRRVRSSILLAGPLAARHGRAVLFPPGGDGIGRRRLDTHFYGLRALGIDVDIGSVLSLRRRRLHGADLILDEASVTATENILMAAVLARGPTSLYHAACEPHVRDLCALLTKMGARIEGAGTNCLRVRGVRRLGGARHTVEADHIEIGSFAAAAVATRGGLDIAPCGPPRPLQVIGRGLEKLGVRWQCERGVLTVPENQQLEARNDIDAALPTIEDGPWPAFPSDLMSVAIVLATQVRGNVLFFEKLFESRMYFVDRLITMGARIVQCDPHRVVVMGPSRLRGDHQTSPDIRAGMALLVAALCAEGESVIENAQMIDRGYERIDERLRALGADIERSG